MKPATPLTITHPLARHDRRDRRNQAFPTTDYHFRPETSATRASQRPPDAAAARSFRRMTTELLAAQNRRVPLELIVLAFVTAIIAWPLLDLVIVLVQTAR